ncbi:hypothetical protein Acr_15g0019750 [Actinidia rufa]|uniref:Uncharacterized protein n=1 Tax=Actinidia rufa TaxID=165716 RepID=A0A7J0FY12_9ERIC|nr:hypothetical protein Acr_15g0019750 [Actinidia rufa]
MSADNNVFVAWEEHILSQEKGNRVVHFLLKNERGESVLAVVGTERSVRHMIYVVADEYLPVYGSEGFTNVSTKWRARRQVVDWLTTMVSKHRPPLDISILRLHRSSKPLGPKDLFKKDVRISSPDNISIDVLDDVVFMFLWIPKAKKASCFSRC